MSLIGIHSIWHRKVTPGDFFNIERRVGAGPSGGGGQLYIDVPESVRVGLFTMLDRQRPCLDSGNWPELSIDAKVLGNTSRSGAVTFEHIREGETRYRIPHQNRQSPSGSRHPAWADGNGFPVASNDVDSTASAGAIIAGGLRIFIVRSLSGYYYAGFTQGTAMPPSWPVGAGLEVLFSSQSPGGVVRPRTLTGYSPVVKRILDAWRRKPNVLLYGPAGTGKTYAMSCIWEIMQLGRGTPVVMLDPDDRGRPFHVVDCGLPMPVAQDWVTFHQSYGYEDFIVGLRPIVERSGSGFTLRPRAGRLLDLAFRVYLDAFEEQSAVMLVDELNRGNVSRVFGEFITFMEHTYRDVDGQGEPNPRRLPVPLASVNTSAGYSEPIELASGGAVKLPVPWYFPRAIYTLASMNSVDRTVAPLDSALARRFERVDMAPDLEDLQRWLGVDLDDTSAKVLNAGAGAVELNAPECAVLILARLNFQLATSLGPDFEIGHTYMMPVGHAVGDDDGFRRLAVVWDQGIMPQLQERFLTRQDELLRILGVDAGVPEGYAFRSREGWFGQEGGGRPAIEAVSLEELADRDMEQLRVTFRYMASHL